MIEFNLIRSSLSSSLFLKDSKKFHHWSIQFKLAEDDKYAGFIFVHMINTGIEFFATDVENDYSLINDSSAISRLQILPVRFRINAFDLVDLICQAPHLKKPYSAAYSSNNCIDFAIYLSREMGYSERDPGLVELMKDSKNVKKAKLVFGLPFLQDAQN